MLAIYVGGVGGNLVSIWVAKEPPGGVGCGSEFSGLPLAHWGGLAPNDRPPGLINSELLLVLLKKAKLLDDVNKKIEKVERALRKGCRKERGIPNNLCKH